MNYPEMKKNQFGVPYRYLETIGTREYWQMNNYVSSAEPGSRRLSEGTPDECWPAETRMICSFDDWNERRVHLLHLVDIQPYETQRRCITFKKDLKDTKIITGTFYTVAGMMGVPEIEDLFVLVEEYDNEHDFCYLWSGCGTDLLFQIKNVPKCWFGDLSANTLRRFTNTAKYLNADCVAKRVMDSLEKEWPHSTDILAFHWLRAIGYDTSAIDAKRDEKHAQNEERKKQEQEAARRKKEVDETQRQKAMAESMRMIREGIVQDKRLELKDLPYGHEVLVSLFQAEGLALPLRTQGWVYEKLHSVTGDSYSWHCQSRRERGSKTFADLLGKLRDKLIEGTV